MLLLICLALILVGNCAVAAKPKECSQVGRSPEAYCKVRRSKEMVKKG
jgi:hypothetical protein